MCAVPVLLKRVSCLQNVLRFLPTLLELALKLGYQLVLCIHLPLQTLQVRTGQVSGERGVFLGREGHVEDPLHLLVHVQAEDVES